MDVRAPGKLAYTAAIVISIVAGILLGCWNLSRSRARVPDQPIRVVHDAGQVFADTSPRIAHRFEVKNETGKPIKFLKKECTCTCTTTNLDKVLLQPGESGFFEMNLPTPANYSGQTNVRCELTFDDHVQRVYSMSFEAFPRSMVERENIDLGESKPTSEGNLGHGEVDPSLITNLDLFGPVNEPWPSLENVETPREFATSIQGPPIKETFNKIKRTRYRVRIRPNTTEMKSLKSGSHVRTITFESSDGSSTYTKVSWRVPNRFMLNPSPVYFGMLERGSGKRSMKLRVKSVNRESIRLTDAQSDSAYLKVEQAHPHQVSGDGTLELVFTLALPADDSLGFLAGNVRVTLNGATTDVLDVPWSAILRPAIRSTGFTQELFQSEKPKNELP